MVDYTLCMNHYCPLKKKCWRYQTKGDPKRQSYSNFKYDRETNMCDYFIEIRHETKGS